MNEYANSIKEKLDTLLTEMHEYSSMFVNNPEKDFTRKRKLNFKDMLSILLSMEGNSLKLELMKYFSYDVETATSSAFVQQRDKILPDALELIFHRFTASAVNPNYYDGYRMLAVDGSDLRIAHNPNDTENYFLANENEKGHNLIHLNAMYDLCSRVYVDAIVQPGRKKNEFQALNDMVDRSDIKEETIVTADRGYEGYNVFEHIKKKGWNYVIRVKDIGSSGIASTLSLPNQEIFDIEYSTLLTRRQTKEIKEHREKYKFMALNQKFDYLPVGDKGIYPINFRVVRFAISENTYEVIITNLTEKEFPAEKIKEIYHLRWGIMPISALSPLCRYFFNADSFNICRLAFCNISSCFLAISDFLGIMKFLRSVTSLWEPQPKVNAKNSIKISPNHVTFLVFMRVVFVIT